MWGLGLSAPFPPSRLSAVWRVQPDPLEVREEDFFLAYFPPWNLTGICLKSPPIFSPFIFGLGHALAIKVWEVKIPGQGQVSWMVHVLWCPGGS